MTGHSRQLVRHVLRGLHGDVFRTRQSSLDAYLARLDVHWVQGCHNSAKLWRRLKLEGFRGSLRVVSEWATRRRCAEKASDQQLQKVPSARTIARLMTTARDQLSNTDTVMIAAIEAGVPMLVDARRLIDQFHAMVRKQIASDFFRGSSLHAKVLLRRSHPAYRTIEPPFTPRWSSPGLTGRPKGRSTSSRW